MFQTHVVQLAYTGLLLILILSAPPILISMFFGVVVAIFQAATQIQEQTLFLHGKAGRSNPDIDVYGRMARRPNHGLSQQCFFQLPHMGRCLSIRIPWHTDNSYLDLYVSSGVPESTPEGMLSLLMLTLCRLLPIIGMSPFFGAKILAHPAKVVFAICLFFIFLPQLLVTTNTPLTFNLSIIFLAAKELFIGISLGFLVQYSLYDRSECRLDHRSPERRR